MITVWALVVWFGFSSSQSSFAISNIASEQECQRLGKAMAQDKLTPQINCYPYRVVK